jgi:deoxyxylulose-5-phosphate synthase
MNTKLTLKLDLTTIEKAKHYAKSRKTSVSSLVENYLKKLTNEKKRGSSITPLVKSLSGIVELPKDFDHRKAYADHLITKYK